MSTTNVHVIGCGGIGSYFAHHLYILNQQGQLPGVTCCLYDFDEVENKNLMYQNFTPNDLYRYKSEALGVNYGFDFRVKKITDFKELNGIVCLCVDNVATRKAFFNSAYLDDNPSPKHVSWIDMRCQGAQVAYYVKSKKNTREEMLKTLPEKEEEGTGSCQYSQDLHMKRIQQGNKIIAAIGSQLLLNIIRNEPMTSSFIHGF
jgi:hypothetical protein